MKRKIKEEIRSKTIPELLKEILKAEEVIRKSKMEISIGKLKNTSILKVLSDNLAVMKTIYKEKLLAVKK